jgi:hypothetical protein
MHLESSYDIHPKVFAEMNGYIIATTQLNLPHTLLWSIVVSTTTATNQKGWPYVDALPHDRLCSPPPTAALPSVCTSANATCWTRGSLANTV